MKKKSARFYLLSAAIMVGAQFGLTACSSAYGSGVSSVDVSDQMISEESEQINDDVKIEEGGILSNVQNRPSDNLLDYTFTLNGVTYTLPCSVQSFMEAGGWSYDEMSRPEDTEISGSSGELFYFTDGKALVGVEIYNPSRNVQKAKDCNIGTIEINNSADIDLLMAKGR